MCVCTRVCPHAAVIPGQDDAQCNPQHHIDGAQAHATWLYVRGPGLRPLRVCPGTASGPYALTILALKDRHVHTGLHTGPKRQAHTLPASASSAISSGVIALLLLLSM